MDELGLNSASFSISVISYVIYSKTRGKLHSKLKVLMMLCLITCFVCFFHPFSSDLLNGPPYLRENFLFEFLGTLLASLALNLTLFWLFKVLKEPE